MGRVALAAVSLVAACTFHHGAATTAGSDARGPDDAGSDAPPADALVPGDAPGDASAPSCQGRWAAGTIRFSAPVKIGNVNSTSVDRDPFLSPDELAIYFSSERAGSSGGADVWKATRANLAGAFSTPVQFADVNSSGYESKMSMTTDGLIVMVGSDRTGGAGGVDVWQATRASTAVAFGGMNRTHLGNVETSANEYDPQVNGLGLNLYLAPTTGGQHLVVATRPAVNMDFLAPTTTAVAAVNNSTGECDPAVSPDELLLVFSSSRSGGSAGGVDLWYATRLSTAVPFGAPLHVPDINSSGNEGDGFVSPDGCRLYFSSDKGGDYDLYVATAQ